MDLVLKIVRWILGLFVLLGALGAFLAKTPLAGVIVLLGALVLIPPSGDWIGRAFAPIRRHGPALGIGVVLFFVGMGSAAITAGNDDTKALTTATAPDALLPPATPPTAAPAPSSPAPAPAIDVASKISPDAVMPIEGEGWDKTRREWGATWIKRINGAMDGAARKAAQSPDCDRVEVVGLSDRSTPKKTIVYFVDCRNEQRFYISEDDSKADALVASKNAQTAAISDGKALEACEASVKGQLHYASTYDRDLLNTRVHRAPTGNIAVEFTFQAKNALGAELPHRARCVIDDEGIHPAEISTN